MKGAKLTERDDHSNGLSIFGPVHILGSKVGAIWIRLSSAGQRNLDGFSGGSDHVHVKALHWNCVARLHLRMFRLAIDPWIRLLQERIGLRNALHISAVVDELSNRNAAGEHSHAAEVIEMPVSGDQVIDLLKSRIF